MENVALLALLTALIIAGLFLMLRRSPKDDRAQRFVERRLHPRPEVHSRVHSTLPKADPLDPQTRFIEPTKRKPYRLLNDSEQELYQRLCEAMPNMRVFAQVGVVAAGAGAGAA